MDTKNVIAAISLSAAVIILYSLFFAPPPANQKQMQSDKNINSKTIINDNDTDAPSLDQSEEVSKISRNEAMAQEERIILAIYAGLKKFLPELVVGKRLDGDQQSQRYKLCNRRFSKWRSPLSL